MLTAGPQERARCRGIIAGMNTRSAQTTPPFPDRADSVLLPGPAGAIELACALPEAANARAGVAIICHPHPLQGGTMHNKVVTIIERAFLVLSLATVRFTFRGVVHSEVVHDNGVGVTVDVVSIADWLPAVLPAPALWLVSFSFFLSLSFFPPF